MNAPYLRTRFQSVNKKFAEYSCFPELWKQLRKWDDGTWQKFRADYSVRDLEMRFELEKEWLAVGKNIRCRNFYTELKGRIMKKQDVPM